MKFAILQIATICIGVVDPKPAFLNVERPVLCEYNGLTFSPGEGRYLDHIGCKITIVRCRAGGKVELEEKYDCSITSSKAPKPTTTRKSTTHPALGPVCYYEGTYFRPEELIHEVRHKGVCFGAYCSKEAVVVEFENIECNSTVTTTKKPAPTTENSLEFGCVVDGVLYEPGEILSRYQRKDKCVEVFCQLHETEKREIKGKC